MRFNIPTLLTLFRIILIPFFILIFYLPFTWTPLVCALIFVFAAITDWFDGFLARKWKQTTRFGAFLDPVADKVIISTALVLISEYYHVWWITLPAATMITREIIISALREWMAELGKRNNIAVSWIGKIKTVSQMLSLIALLWRPDSYVVLAGVVAFYVSTILTFWSMFQYLKAARNYLLEL
ncbi:CDP-diacylglycerol--glycerol-3-phosphate 3-phosphatidyltransferase [Candidatus Profftia lariciata]|uniref:CDP-diacylglycerol--glycerol-3-phosphate 3-phosphatidyltransferase n=1 Tax=Candidatus Profftia lariciata TaxID=1987921 RepID=UPI001D024588|nr:CDP-diacylglycerol--glycerol-3-phosphate 3-phosphatidyltransferase [Candidatus Profftia lariciata]